MARPLRTAGAALALSLLAGCGLAPAAPGSAATSSATTTAPAAATAHPVPGGEPATVDYRAGLQADVYLPVQVAPGKPVVLLVPGGGWATADRSGLAPLAEKLRGYGNVVVSITYSTTDEGAAFPTPVQDVLCAAAFARRQATDVGAIGGPLVVVGHSAGGHLAAVAALSASRFAVPCADPPTSIDGLVGMAGVYDTTDFTDMMTAFFGAARGDDPALWQSGDPLTYAATGNFPARLPVLLLHGDADTVVPLSQARAFATALQHNGAPATQLVVLPGVEHLGLLTSEDSGARIGLWLRGTYDQWGTASPPATASG